MKLYEKKMKEKKAKKEKPSDRWKWMEEGKIKCFVKNGKSSALNLSILEKFVGDENEQKKTR